ncbi:hypothetical protein D3C79_1067300 [compost metagenome]
MRQGIDDRGWPAFQIEVFGNGFAGIPVQPVDVNDPRHYREMRVRLVGYRDIRRANRQAAKAAK